MSGAGAEVRERVRPRWVEVTRRGPILRPSRALPAGSGVYGLDLTAGCGHGCAFCHIRGAATYPGAGRVLFDPGVSGKLAAALDALESPPQLVVMSPTSDPLPPHRGVRAEAVRSVRALLARGVEVLVMTRGRVPRAMVEALAEGAGRGRVALGLMTLDRAISRRLEPGAAPAGRRLAGLALLSAAGVPVEVRLEPLIAGWTDTRAALMPLFAALARAGARRVVAHYLFLHPAMADPFRAALGAFGLAERLDDAYEGGPVFPVGTLGPTKHLPTEARREGLARLIAWGAEHGLIVETGTAQNPDLPRSAMPTAPPPPARPRAARERGRSTAAVGT